MHRFPTPILESLRDENRPHPGNRTDRKEAGLLGWAEQEFTCGQLGPNLRRTRASWPQFKANVSMQVGLSMRNLVLYGGICLRSWTQDRPNLGRMALHELHRSEPEFTSCKNATFQRAAKTLAWAALKMGPRSGQLARSWSQLGGSWSQLVQVGRKLGPFWLKLTPSQANVVAMSDGNDAFVRFCADLQNMQMTSNDHSLVPAEAVPV